MAFYIKINDGNWQPYTLNTDISVSMGDKVQIKGDYNNRYYCIQSETRFNAYGNAMSFCCGDNFKNKKDMTGKSLAYLFQNTSIVNANKLLLPATTLSIDCYSYMFIGCTSLISTPELPATTLMSRCYQYMFEGCESLTTAPELPAASTEFACYNYMFYGCTNLNYIKCLATDIDEYSNSTTYWVSGVASSGTFVKSSNATAWPRGNYGIPTNWTVQDA